jgi:hypothetical protein
MAMYYDPHGEMNGEGALTATAGIGSEGPTLVSGESSGLQVEDCPAAQLSHAQQLTHATDCFVHIL